MNYNDLAEYLQYPGDSNLNTDEEMEEDTDY